MVDIGTVHEAAEKFTDHLKALVDTAIPQREIVERKGTHPWISNSVLQLVQERNAAMGTPEESAAILKCSDGMLAAHREFAYMQRIDGHATGLQVLVEEE